LRKDEFRISAKQAENEALIRKLRNKLDIRNVSYKPKFALTHCPDAKMLNLTHQKDLIDESFLELS